PDYIIIGEIRGEEAYVLFQALATGHGGLCTIHADSIDNVVKRLTSPPMNVSKVYIPLMNIAILVQRVELPKKREGFSFGRRIRNVWEIEDFEQYRDVASWDPRNDKFNTNFEDSFHLRRIVTSSGLTMEAIMKELDARENFLREIIGSGIRDQREIAKNILSYYSRKKDEKTELKLATIARPPQLQPPQPIY
ncbi:Flp pilus assembly complex ATPase component TadA, partial [Candidatus Bathyarchaeota archaeon]|nr:Flp pilus assembly complex ATPase component TadA [Candidatus Bathyarchaeota archaeon]